MADHQRHVDRRLKHTSANADTDADAEKSASTELDNLRKLAQLHLQEIDVENEGDSVRAQKAEQDLQRYSKVKRNPKQLPWVTLCKESSRAASQSATAAAAALLTTVPTQQPPSTLATAAPTAASGPRDEKGPKLRSASDVLDRLRWDPTYNISDYTIGYLERFEGIKEMSATSWISETTDEDWIPQHRIRYIKFTKPVTRDHESSDDNDGDRIDHEGEIVWDRDAKIDKIFGSAIVSEPGLTVSGKEKEADILSQSEYGVESVAGGADL